MLDATFSFDPDCILTPEEKEKIVKDYLRLAEELKTAEQEIKPVIAHCIRFEMEITEILFGASQEGVNAGL